jgi:hypothetical protein
MLLMLLMPYFLRSISKEHEEHEEHEKYVMRSLAYPGTKADYGLNRIYSCNIKEYK